MCVPKRAFRHAHALLFLSFSASDVHHKRKNLRAFQFSAKRGLQRAASPVPEREAAHLGDAIAGPRNPLFSQPPQAAKRRIGKPWEETECSLTFRNGLTILVLVLLYCHFLER